MDAVARENLTPYSGEWRKSKGEPNPKVKKTASAIREKIKGGTRPAEALKTAVIDEPIIESAPKAPENIDIKAASQNISSLMSEAQKKQDNAETNRISNIGKKLGFESAPKPLPTSPVETTPADFDTTQAEIKRMQENPTATINPDLSEDIRNSVMNSVLSGESPIKVTTPKESMKETKDKEWAVFIDKQNQAKEFYKNPPDDREKNELYHTYIARTNFLKSPPENYVPGESWNDYVLRGGPEEQDAQENLRKGNDEAYLYYFAKKMATENGINVTPEMGRQDIIDLILKLPKEKLDEIMPEYPTNTPDILAKTATNRKEPQTATNSPEKPIQEKPFSPSESWQEIPDGTPVPPGGTFKMDMNSGKNYGKWSKDLLDQLTNI